MTFPSPILVSALVLAGVALLAVRLKALAEQRRSMVRVRAKRRPNINTRNQG